MRQAQTEARKEIEEYRAQREAKLRAVQPEVCCIRPLSDTYFVPSLVRSQSSGINIHTRSPTLQAQALDEKVRRVTQDTSNKISMLE